MKVLLPLYAPDSLMERLLVSTALEASWSDTEPMLFLGEWCRLYSRRDRLLSADTLVLPYHWDDRRKLEQDRQYLDSVYEELLAELGRKLNVVHGVDHGNRYWRILLGPWLGYFTQTLFDRWRSVQAAVEHYEISETVVLTGLPDARVPNDMTDFLYMADNQQWNHYIYARILTDFTEVPIRFRPFGDTTNNGGMGPVASPSPTEAVVGLKHRLVQGYSRRVACLSKRDDVFVVNSCLRSQYDEMALQLRLRQVPRLIQPEIPLSAVPADADWRKWKLDGGRGFGECVRCLVPEQIPTAYLEGYEALLGQVGQLRWPRSPKAIFTSGSHHFDDLFKAWCAGKTEMGAPLVIGQHGGHVGTAWSFSHDHELAIADRFLSWGWSDPEEPKVVPVGMLKAPTLPHSSTPARNRAVMVTDMFPLQTTFLGSHPLTSQFLDYLEDQFAFVEGLPPAVSDTLVVRLSVWDGLWDQRNRWLDRVPTVNLDDGTRPIMDLLAEARVCIAAQNGTTYLESIFLGIPTIIFWDPCRWELLESAKPYFEDLARVGVFHETPESAAAHLARVWNDVEAWWATASVADVVADFSERFCRNPGNVVESLADFLQGISDGGPR